MVDADDDEAFAAQLMSLQEVWDQRETQVTKADPTFYSWFLKHCSSVVQHSMLTPVREGAGLGSPPIPFYTNAVESINSLLKLRTDHRKQELPIFIERVKNAMETQFMEVDRAIAGLGDYQVLDGYRQFQFSAAK